MEPVVHELELPYQGNSTSLPLAAELDGEDDIDYKHLTAWHRWYMSWTVMRIVTTST
jgi:hypothetical protein